jgi:hypothetical protein
MRDIAVALFNRVWELMEQPDRTERETDLMLHAAHASRYHWEEAGEAVQHARGEWQISRAYTVAGRAEPAVHHARRCLEIAEGHGLGAFDVGFAHEALARAHALAGDSRAAARHAEQARAIASGVADEEDRQVLLDDLKTLS